MKKVVSIMAAEPSIYHPADPARGLPERAMWPKLPMRIGGEEFVVDLLAQLTFPGQNPQLVVIEFDEWGISPESRRVEQLLAPSGIPLLRLSPADFQGADYAERLDRKLLEASSAGTGRITRILGITRCA